MISTSFWRSCWKPAAREKNFPGTWSGRTWKWKDEIQTRVFVEPIAGLLVLLVLVGGLTWYLREPTVEFIQGEVDATQVDLAVKIAGRVSTVWVKEGQSVEKGDHLLDLDIPEIRAKLRQAAAAEQAAGAQRDKAFAGTRRQEIQAAMNLWRQAKEAAGLAETTYRRVERLYADGVVPAQRRDEAEAKWKTSREAAAAAHTPNMTWRRKGAREEDRRSASAMVDQAGGAVSEVKSYLSETRLDAPIGGEVVHVLADRGELVSPGYPIVTIFDLTDVWVTFNIREDNLAGLRMGETFTVRVPALGDRKFNVKVSYISPLGDFATWRATSASGGFDLKTFEVRARPVNSVDGLRPGMSVIVPLTELLHDRS
jgi:HlyD family secretion protein